MYCVVLSLLGLGRLYPDTQRSVLTRITPRTLRLLNSAFAKSEL